MKLSIFLAGMRKTNWLNLYQSIAGSTTIKDYELVIVSPYRDDEIPKFVHTTENIKHIYDKGCPTRCYQLGLLHSQGEYVVWVADDGVFCPNLAIDKAFDLLPRHDKGIVSMKYMEGEQNITSIAEQDPDSFWKMGVHKVFRRCRYIANDYFLIMIGLMRRDYLMKIGGWDCRFEQPGISCVDLAIRLQNDGAEVVLGIRSQDVDWGRGTDQWGVDHTPIEMAHNKNDKPLFLREYNSPSGSSRGCIDINNWKNVPDVWHRRFDK